MKLMWVILLIFSSSLALADNHCQKLISNHPELAYEVLNSDVLLIGEDHSSTLSLVNDVPLLPIIKCLDIKTSIVFEHIFHNDLMAIQKVNTKDFDVSLFLNEHSRFDPNNKDQYEDLLSFTKKNRELFKIDGGDLNWSEINNTFSKCHNLIENERSLIAAALLGSNYKNIINENEALFYELGSCDGNYFRDLKMTETILKHSKKSKLTLFYSGALHMYSVSNGVNIISPELRVSRVSIGKNDNSKITYTYNQEEMIGKELTIGEPHDKVAWDKEYDKTPQLLFTQMEYFLKSFNKRY